MTTQIIEQVNIAALHRNPERQMRVASDETRVEKYRERTPADDDFPPILVCSHGDADRLVDGYQRAQTEDRAEIATLPAIIKEGDTLDPTLAANRIHGLRRSNSDKRRTVPTMLHDREWQRRSNNGIVAHCGASHAMVGSLGKDLESEGEIESVSTRRVEWNGQVIQMGVSGFSSEPEAHGVEKRQLGANNPPSPFGRDSYDPDDDSYDGPLHWDHNENDAGNQLLPEPHRAAKVI